MTTLAAVIIEGVYADIGAGGIAGRIYFATDTKRIYYDNGATWDDVTPSGGVTSVGLVLPAWLSVAGSPLVAAGTLTVTENTQAANTFLRGPDAGAAAAPAFGPLVAADFPATAVIPGTYSSADITVGADGRITAAANGSGGAAVLQVNLAPAAAGNFQVAHGLGSVPTSAMVAMTSDGRIWFQSPRFDGTYLYLVASDAGITGVAEVS